MFAIKTALACAVLSTAAARSAFSPVDARSLFKRISSGCGTSGELSCQNTTAVENLCCFEAPGGLLLQTQAGYNFWDTDPATGPDDSWTIHGLWPDNCDGTFEQSCDPDREYSDISTLLTDQGASDTLDFMQQYWVDINGKNEQFWEHEWGKHGTCMSTLEPSCLPDGSPEGAEAVAFFQTVVKLFKSLPTYEWLSKAGITPGSGEHDLSDVVAALKSASGVTPALDCSSGALNQISYYYNLKGSVIDGDFELIDAPEKGSCGSTVKYPSKS
ncbi:base non-specific acid ribonuclease [Amylostereum chailletii]|nr:base non-specific acid ribonuclease [Amylostereum chailletii]